MPLAKSYLNYDNLDIKQKIKIKEHITKLEIIKVVEIFFSKKNKKENSNLEVYTIKKYYDYNNFRYIKSIVKDDIVLPINIIPAKLTANDIKVIGGLYQFYPQSYFDTMYRLLIGELELSDEKHKAFLKKRHKIYASVKDPHNVKINFNIAKKMNAKYVLSNIKLYNENLKKVCLECNLNSSLNLYIIK